MGLSELGQKLQVSVKGLKGQVAEFATMLQEQVLACKEGTVADSQSLRSQLSVFMDRMESIQASQLLEQSREELERVVEDQKSEITELQMQISDLEITSESVQDELQAAKT